MKKIPTICLVTILLHSAFILNAQGLYSDMLKEASFTSATSPGEIFTPRYTGVIADLDVKKIAGGGAQLTWKVSDLNSVSYFDIQRSDDNRQFITIGTVGTNEKNVYRFTEDEPIEGAAFFRIKYVDTDGVAHYSSVVSVAKDPSSVILIAYPMPAQSEITVQHALVSEKGLISVHTPDGNLVMSVTPAMGSMQTTLDLSYLKAGVYLLRFNTGGGRVETMRIVKQ